MGKKFPLTEKIFCEGGGYMKTLGEEDSRQNGKESRKTLVETRSGQCYSTPFPVSIFARGITCIFFRDAGEGLHTPKNCLAPTFPKRHWDENGKSPPIRHSKSPRKGTNFFPN